MTNRELFAFQQALELVSDLPGCKFAYAVAKNKAKISSIIETLYKAKRHPKEEEFEKRRVEICEKHCDRDGDGNPVLEHNAFQGLHDNADFDTDIDKLREEFKEVMDHRHKEAEAYEVKLNEEAKFDIHKIFFDAISENITANQIMGILPMIIDPQ